MPTIYDVLIAEHKQVAALFELLEGTTSRAENTRARELARLQTLLEIHMKLEEELLYPLLKDLEPTRDMTLEAYEEHKGAKIALHSLMQTPVTDDVWDAQLKVLKEMIEHHLEEEETDLFATARSLLTTRQAQQIGAAFVAGRSAWEGQAEQYAGTTRRAKTESETPPRAPRRPPEQSKPPVVRPRHTR